MELGPAAYVVAFLGSLALAWVATPVAIRVASRFGVLDEPTAVKAQAAPVPYLGGAAIVLGFAVAVIVAQLIVRPVSGTDELLLVLGLALLLATMGFVDDLRGLGPFVRLIVEIAAALALVAFGVSVTTFAYDWINVVVTVLWVVGIVNAFNLLDNMDGLSAGTAAIASAWFFVLAALNGQFLVASLSAGLCGCTLGFLRHNFHPARVYMGDAGSLFIGFMLAVIGMRLRFDSPTQVTFLVPILVCGVAVFDTALVTFNRVRHGRSPLSGGRDHMSHRLVFMGLPVPWSVGTIYTTGLALGWVALVVARIDRVSAYLLVGLVGLLALLLGRMLSHVPVYGPTTRRVMRLGEQTEADLEGSAWAAGSGPIAPQRLSGRGDSTFTRFPLPLRRR